MWLCTRYGFFSITMKKDMEWHVRGRCREDLEALRAACGIDTEIHNSKGADYRWRIVLYDAHALHTVFSALATSVDYTNFKGMIGRTPGQADKLEMYHRWWSDMYAFQEEHDAGG